MRLGRLRSLAHLAQDGQKLKVEAEVGGQCKIRILGNSNFPAKHGQNSLPTV